MRIVRYIGRLLNRVLQGVIAVALLAVVGFLLDKLLLGDQPRGRPGGSPTPPPSEPPAASPPQ